MKSISTSGLLKLIESKKIKGYKEVTLFFNPSIDYVLFLKGLFELHNRYESSSEEYIKFLQRTIKVTFSYMCLHYPELAKQYINSIRSEHELSLLLPKAYSYFSDYLTYYVKKINNKLKENKDFDNIISITNQNQAEIIGGLLVERWYPLVKKFFSQYKNVFYISEYSYSYNGNIKVIDFLLRSDNNDIFCNILDVESFLIKSQGDQILSSFDIRELVSPIPMKKVKNKFVPDIEKLNEKIQMLSKADLIVIHSKDPIESFIFFHIPIHIPIQDCIDLSKIPFENDNEYLFFKKIKSIKLDLCVGYKDGYNQILWEDKNGKSLCSLSVSSLYRSSPKDKEYFEYKSELKYKRVEKFHKYEKHLLSQIMNIFEKSNYPFKVKLKNVMFGNKENPLLDQILKIKEVSNNETV
ncbi:MAG: hypothetical protein NC816_00755 [Candidatus Omnitrophica bacterium]|nr:hypothetical protein [Candidatus Omnitrophota bacterium]